MRLLVIDGNTAAVNAANTAAGGSETGQRYSAVLARLAPDAKITITHPADGEQDIPQGLGNFDGAVITGSALNLYDRTPEITRQIELTRTLIHEGVPMFGSCWGLQVGVAALGGVVRKNPRGREIGFARRIRPVGGEHPLHAGKTDEPVYDAICVHLDEIGTIAPGMTVLASNAMSEVQAAEWKDARDRPLFWGVQYHPEYDFREIAAVMKRYGDRLVSAGHFADRAAMDAHISELMALQDTPERPDLVWKFGLDTTVTRRDRREHELAQWLAHVVRPGTNQ